MKIKCRYCESIMPDTSERCPNCGALNTDMARGRSWKPQTLGELKDFCEANSLPLEKMRFFIGEDKKEPKCFGIYEDNGYFTVYKNKADGTRAIRYEGYDEAYAVGQIYDKLKEEVSKRAVPKKEVQPATSRPSYTPHSSYNNYSYQTTHKQTKDHTGLIIVIIASVSAILAIGLIALLVVSLMSVTPSRGSITTQPAYSTENRHRGGHKGYYEYLDDYYYYDGYDYYIYDPYTEHWDYYDDDDFYLGDGYWMDYDDAYDMFYDDPYFDDWYSDYDYNNTGNWWGSGNSSWWSDDDEEDDDSWWSDDDDDDSSWWSDWDDDDDDGWDYDYDSWDSWDTDWDTDW